jgi:hypothetical protein
VTQLEARLLELCPLGPGSREESALGRNDVGLRKWEPQVPQLRYPGFSVQFGGVGELHAAFFTESRTRCHGRCHVVENPGTLCRKSLPSAAKAASVLLAVCTG